MKELSIAYKCDYCGKVFSTKSGASIHEKSCRYNPQNARACYTCKHYDAEKDRPCTGEDDRYVVENIEVEFPLGTMIEPTHFVRNVCKVDSLLLYNPRRMSEWKREWLYNSDNWKPMPSAFGGCEHYEPHEYFKPKYPVSHKIEEEKED